MAFGDDVVTDGESQAGALPCWLGGKKGLEDFMLYFIRNTCTVIPNFDFEFILLMMRTHFQFRLIIAARLPELF